MQQEQKEWIKGLALGSPFIQALDIDLVSIGKDCVHLRLPISKEFVGVGNPINIGAIAAIAEAAGTAVALVGTNTDTLAGCSTSQLSITYLTFATGAYLEAKANVVHRTDKQVVSDVMLAVDGQPLAKATAICRMFAQDELADAA